MVQTRNSSALSDLWQPEHDLDPVGLSGGSNYLFKICGALLLGIFLVALFVPIGSAVIGHGQVGIDGRVKRVAHPTGGVISEIAVVNGQHVVKGQLLMRLKDTVTASAAEYASLTVEQLLAQRARLSAERSGLQGIAFPPELTRAPTETARKAMADETHVFQLRARELTDIRGQLAKRVIQYEQGIAGYEAQITAFQKQRDLIQPELAGLRALWEKRLVTIGRLNELERTAVSLDGNIASLQADIAQTRARIAETQQQALQLGESRRADAATELARVNQALNEEQLESISAGDVQDNSAIRAPYTGVVEKIAFAAIGDVVRPADAIMEIVPDGDTIVVEAAISPADVDQVRAGQTAHVRFSSFNRATTPEIAGRVTYVAGDRTSDERTGESYFLVRVELDQARLRNERLALRTGMPAEVYIETGNRPMLSYLTKPLRDQFARAFRDN